MGYKGYGSYDERVEGLNTQLHIQRHNKREKKK